MHLSGSVVSFTTFRTDSSATSYTFFRFCVAFGYGNKWLVHLSATTGMTSLVKAAYQGRPGGRHYRQRAPKNVHADERAAAAARLFGWCPPDRRAKFL